MGLTPSLLTADLGRTLAFYGKLGFQVTGRDRDEDPRWAEVTRGDAQLWFYVDPPIGTEAAPTCSGTFYVRTEGVAALAEAAASFTELAWGPEVMPYGQLEFAVVDPNGYRVAFSEPAP